MIWRSNVRLFDCDLGKLYSIVNFKKMQRGTAPLLILVNLVK